MSGTIVWFRNDLRLDDNPALDWAVRRGEAIIPVFLYANSEEGAWRIGGASKWWLHHSLTSLGHSLTKLGSNLIIRATEDSPKSLLELVTQTGASAVCWNRRYEPAIVSRDAKIKDELVTCGIAAQSFNGTLLCEPWKGTKADGTPYQVFTPYWKNQVVRGFGTQPLPLPSNLITPKSWPDSLPVDALGLTPKVSWDTGFKVWNPGETGAKERLTKLLSFIVATYDDTRNLPAQAGTSMLSPHLHFGEISSNSVVHAIRQRYPQPTLPIGVETYVKEIVWREFAYHLLFHFPSTPTEPLNPRFSKFPWTDNPLHLTAWQTGMTGYPIIDAGMRELWATGWMHNRVRMIVASFLVKHLLIRWQEGAAWFWDTLVDADLASNTMGWQWSGGCGADAAPYFRIFNPMLQGAKFDPKGEYVKRWCPELKDLDAKFIHSPWDAGVTELSTAGITLGKSYPFPIVSHSESRERAIEAYGMLKGG